VTLHMHRSMMHSSRDPVHIILRLLNSIEYLLYSVGGLLLYSMHFSSTHCTLTETKFTLN